MTNPFRQAVTLVEHEPILCLVTLPLAALTAVQAGIDQHLDRTTIAIAAVTAVQTVLARRKVTPNVRTPLPPPPPISGTTTNPVGKDR